MGDNDRVIPPPYIPYRTFKGYLDGMKQSGIPGKIDRSVLRNRSGAEQTMLINALAYLRLISDNGIPMEALGELVNAEGPDRQKVLRSVLMTRYPFLFSDKINLNNAVPSQLSAAFGEAGVSGDTIRKAVAFFLAAAEDAAIPLSSYLKVKPGRAAGSRRRRVGSNGDVLTDPTGPPPSHKTLFQTLIDILDPDTMDEAEQQAVWTLIRYLKKQEAGSGA
jgi:hypothetical protein